MDSLSRTSIREQIGAADPAAHATGASVRVLEPVGQFYVTGGALQEPNTRVGDGACVLWLAPDRTLVVADAPPDVAFVSDVTDGLVLFEIAGPRAGEIIASGCTVDPAGPLLAPGRCVQTVFGGVKVVLYAFGNAFRLHAERPFAAFLLEWLSRAVSALKGSSQ